MKRLALSNLKTWFNDHNSKPLIIRGARQVGKSTLVRLFSEDVGLDLIELNLEIEKLSSVEDHNFDLNKLLDEIQLKKGKIINEKTLIFFDEIQESPKLLKLLRYFYEMRPDLKVVAAGSLLEIALRSENFSFPVGRVQFLYLGPMSFREFLWATGNEILDERLSEFKFSGPIHEKGLELLRYYLYVGGMPEAVKEYSVSKSIVKVREIQSQLIQAYAADFPKYNRRIDSDRIGRVFLGLSQMVGEKIVYTKLDPSSSSREIKRVVELLTDSRVIIKCVHSSANSSPLLGEVNDKIFKTYFIDVGLLGASLNLNIDAIDKIFKENNIKGKMAEQFVAQHLNYCRGITASPELIYHLKDQGVQKAEVDFVIDIDGQIIPIEVKSSSKGHLKSLKYFSTSKDSILSVKTSLAEYSKEVGFTKDSYLVNIPLYAIEYLNKNIQKIIANE